MIFYMFANYFPSIKEQKIFYHLTDSPLFDRVRGNKIIFKVDLIYMFRDCNISFNLLQTPPFICKSLEPAVMKVCFFEKIKLYVVVSRDSEVNENLRTKETRLLRGLNLKPKQ